MISHILDWFIVDAMWLIASMLYRIQNMETLQQCVLHMLDNVLMKIAIHIVIYTYHYCYTTIAHNSRHYIYICFYAYKYTTVLFHEQEHLCSSKCNQVIKSSLGHYLHVCLWRGILLTYGWSFIVTIFIFVRVQLLLWYNTVVFNLLVLTCI